MHSVGHKSVGLRWGNKLKRIHGSNTGVLEGDFQKDLVVSTQTELNVRVVFVQIWGGSMHITILGSVWLYRHLKMRNLSQPIYLTGLFIPTWRHWRNHSRPCNSTEGGGGEFLDYWISYNFIKRMRLPQSPDSELISALSDFGYCWE